MRPSTVSILFRETVLQAIGALILFIALFGFLLSALMNYYSITDYSETPPKTTYSYTTGKLEYVQSENPGAVVKKINDGFPVKSSIILLFGIYIISRKHKSRKQDEETVRLLDALKNNPKVKITKLSNKLGMDAQEIIARLPDLNAYHGTQYVFNYNSNLIVDNDATIEWDLSCLCENCGATNQTKLIIAIETDSLHCTYCDSKILDAEFENQRQLALARLQRKRRAIGLLPIAIYNRIQSIINKPMGT